MRRGEGKKNRERISQLAMRDSKEAAAVLRSLADALGECRSTSDTILALSEIFCVSERTIYNDLLK